MDLDLPAEDDPRRVDVRRWFTEHPSPTPSELVEAGFVVPHWPRPYGLDAEPELQLIIEDEMRRAGVTKPVNPIGIGHCGPILVALASEEQKQRYLWPMLRGEELWCQLFSEPGAGSDLANLSTRATADGDKWIVNGQKVWTSSAHVARRALLVTRTDPDQPKHRGLTYFCVDMTAPGVEVRPLRQATGEAEFNEVFLTDVVIPDADRIGGVGQGWQVSTATLMNERVALGAFTFPREGGMIGVTARTWREHPELRTPGLHDKLLRLWAQAEVSRLASERLRQQLAAGQPGPEGSGAKLVFARLNQEIADLEVELIGPAGLRYGDWTMRR